MKNLRLLLLLICFYGPVTTAYAQNVSYSADVTFLDRHPIYDMEESKIKSVDSIPDYASHEEPLKLTGVVYESDGLTPAKDVIIFIEQSNDHGNFELLKANEKRYVKHRVWVKTDSEGRYTLYTFVPGNDRTHNQFKQLFPVIKEPSKDAYEIETFLFDDDPLISKYCKKRLTKKGDITRILKPKMVDGVLVAEKNIVLPAGNAVIK
jgi:protocatechuate 3,4-dioxygenase beta subunit